MNEKINNAAPSQAPEVIIPLPRRGLYPVPKEEDKIKKPDKKVAGSVPPKRLGLKISSGIAAGVVGITGIGVGLGESKKLPDALQQPYDNVKAAVGIRDRISYDQDGTPVVDVTQTSKSPETTVAPTTTMAETTTTTREVTTTTEAEIINAPEIAGLIFNQETKSYLNEKGEIVGVYIKDAFQFKGENKDSIALKAEKIESMQKELYEETKDYYFPIPFDLQQFKDMEIDELTRKTQPSEEEKSLVCNPPIGTVFYASFPGEWFFVWSEDRYLRSPFVKMEGVTQIVGASISLYFRDGEILLESTKKDKAVNKKTGEEILIEFFNVTKFGEPLGKITSENTLDVFNNKSFYNFDKPGNYRFGFTTIGRDLNMGGIDRLMKIEDTYISFYNEPANAQNL